MINYQNIFVKNITLMTLFIALCINKPEKFELDTDFALLIFNFRK
jgi:hypothetical protein